MSGFAITESASAVSENRSIAVIPGHDTTSLSDVVGTLKEKYKDAPQTENNIKNLPAVYRSKELAGATQLLAHRYPLAYNTDNYQKSVRELQYMLMGIGCFIFLVYLSWAAIPQINFVQGGNFIYNTGLVGGSLMLVALIYSVFKRVSFLRRLTSSDTWYYLHIGCGALGSYLVIMHSAFDLGSINSTVAFVAMLFVIISGALGRYLFTLSTILLHKQYAEIQETEPSLFAMIDRYECNTSDRIRKRLSEFASHCFRQPKDIFRFLARCFSVISYGIYLYFVSARDLNQIINSISILADLDKQDVKSLRKSQKNRLRQYVFHIIKMGYTSLSEQLLRYWRVLHVPLLYLLAITAIAHVVVVHMY